MAMGRTIIFMIEKSHSLLVHHYYHVISVTYFVVCPLCLTNHKLCLWRATRRAGLPSVMRITLKLCLMRTWVFVTEKHRLGLTYPCDSPVNMNDPIEYLRVVDLILASGLPNYKSVRIPLPSGFNWDYIEQQIQDYHDKIILDYIKFGFPLSINRDCSIRSNATDNHSSAKAYRDEVTQFIQGRIRSRCVTWSF